MLLNMKTNVIRIVCLLLAVFMSVSLFAACGDEGEATKETSSVATSAPAASGNSTTGNDSPTFELQEELVEELTDADPYTIVSDATGKEIVILKKENGVVTMTVAEKTTLKAFTECVAAKVNFKIVITDAQGNEITDENAEIANGMIFNVYEDGKEEAVVTLTIAVVSQEVIEETIEKNEEIKQENEEMKEHNETVAPENGSGSGNNNDGGSTNTPVAIKSTITLGTIWYDQYNGTDGIAKTWQATLKNMETKQGIKTNFSRLDASSAADTIVKEVMAGKASADIFDVSLAMCRNIARKKAAANIYDSKTLNKSAFACGATESVTFSGKAYGITFATKSVNPMGVLYNKKLLAKYAPETDIVKLYNEKKWTFDAFQALAKKCTIDTDGNGKSDIYGFTSNTNIIGMALTSNAGGTALMKNGKVEATMCNAEGVAALEWCKTLFKTDRSWQYKADIQASADFFSGGQAAMFVSYLAFFNTIAPKADFSIGFVLMPIGPAQTEYINGVYDAALYVVPKTNEKRLNDIGDWLNGISGISNKLLNQQVSKLAKNGLDKTGQDIYKALVNNMTAEFSSGPFTSAVSSQVDSSVTSASKSPTKVMAAIKDQAQKECDDFYGPLY